MAPLETAPEQQESDTAARPDLRVVRGDEPLTPVPETEKESETDSDPAVPAAQGDDGITAEAPWQYQLGQTIAAMVDALPGLWSQRPPSYAERVQYSLSGDWTTDPDGQSARRTLHLLGELACIAVDGLIVTPLRAVTQKPSRLGIAALALLILAYAL